MENFILSYNKKGDDRVAIFIDSNTNEIIATAKERKWRISSVMEMAEKEIAEEITKKILSDLNKIPEGGRVAAVTAGYTYDGGVTFDVADVGYTGNNRGKFTLVKKFYEDGILVNAVLKRNGKTINLARSQKWLWAK